MLRVADHIHDQNPSLVEPLDRPRGRNTHGTDEQLCAILNGDFNQLVQLAVRVVVVGLARAATDLRQREIDAKRQRLVVQVALELIDDRLQLLWRVAQSSNDAEATGI